MSHVTHTGLMFAPHSVLPTINRASRTTSVPPPSLHHAPYSLSYWVATKELDTVSVLQCDAVCCSVLQCVAVCCSVLQCVAVSELLGGNEEFGTLSHGRRRLGIK